MRTRFLLPARDELRAAVQYYHRQQTGLGTQFRDEARHTLRRIQDFPLAWHPLGGEIRRCQMRRFPYGLIYLPSASEILVIAVACLHQEPEYWRKRHRSQPP